MQPAADPPPATAITFTGVPASAEALVLSRLLAGEFGGARSVIHVSVNDRGMDLLEQALPFFAPEAEILRFPAWDCLPYDRVSPRPALAAERVRTLTALASHTLKKNLIVLTTVSAFLQRVPPLEYLRSAVFAFEPGKRVAREALIGFLTENGYRRAGKAIESGEYALRGSIVDIVPAGETTGIRLDFFGDELESIREYDPLTQLSSGRRERALLYPAGEAVIGEAFVTRFRSRYREQFGVTREDPLYEAVSAGQQYPGMEHWLPLFYDRLDRLTDYVPDARVTFGNQAQDAMRERYETILDYYNAREAARQVKAADGTAYHPLPPASLYLMQAETEALLERQPHAWMTPFNADPSLRAERSNPAPSPGRIASPAARNDNIALNYRPAPPLAALRAGGDANPFDQLREQQLAARAQGKATLLACLSAGSLERLGERLSAHGTHGVRIGRWREAASLTGKSVGLSVLPLETGFETETVSLITEQDLLGERVIRAVRRKKRSEVFLAEVANFQEGELAVHREHGIGRFEGLVTLEVQGAKHDCLKLLYADDDRLFLPVENIELLSRYGEEEGARLDKLGAASWQARKARMKERIKLAAEALLKTAAERQMRHAPVLEGASGAYDEFTARFGFVETEDQARAIEEVLEDLREARPMDRLVCGDVGFGKTEVALRAAFAATHAIPKVQVAVVVPTTLLARQHYRNFRQRFEGTGIVVRQLSRLASGREQKDTKELLAEGMVDIVIGTHALLSKSVQFKNLGLVIVDEEQHFGVAQKEKLKSLKADVHVLTLSATPIPRTLQMALAGIRSLSLIATPPVDRLAVRSFVMPFDGVVLREAILREKHRGGRSFVVVPRIKDMPEMKVKLAHLVPEARVAVAHGQMAAGALDEIMNDFYDGKYDVLLSTAIVESGLDIPQANTMIVWRADRFGLAQLYQLRGRVGRGKLRAYAYFLLPGQKTLTRDATRRLEVMQSLDSLGAGFQLASHDMDIRGFGNLVGEEQSGHIREVGVELYQQMLEEAVKEVRSLQLAVENSLPTANCQPQTDFSPQINLGLSVLIPEAYVEDLQLRMGLYRRAGQLATREEIDAFAAELIDRFGPPPPEVQHLLTVVRLKQLCRAAGIERVDAGPKGAVLSFHQDRFAHPEALLAYVMKHPTTIKLRPDQKLVLMREWEGEEAVGGISKLLQHIASL